MSSYPWGEAKVWNDRMEAVASLIPRGASVLDLGGGYEHLRQYADMSVYRAIDCYPATRETVVADFNNGQYPDMGQTFQILVVQGTIEYSKFPIAFLENVKKYSSHMILTYNDKGKGSSRVWRNEMTDRDVRDYLSITGWKVAAESTFRGGRLYYAVRQNYGKKR
jgi:hypothetical protein